MLSCSRGSCRNAIAMGVCVTFGAAATYVWTALVRPVLGEAFSLLKCSISPIITAAFCLLPLGLVAISRYLDRYSEIDKKLAEQLPLSPFVNGTIENGQLLLFSFSMLGTLLWLSGVDIVGKRFPVRWLFIAIIVLLGTACIALFSMNADQKNVLPSWLIEFSAWTYVGFILIHVVLIRITTNESDLGKTYKRNAAALIRGMSPEAGQ